MKPVVYIAGPYMNPCPVPNTRAACECWHRLWKSGKVTPIVPHLSIFLDFLNPMPYGEWLEYDLEIVSRCDAVFRLPGASPGADRETKHAESIGTPVFTDEHVLLTWAMSYAENWKEVAR